MNCDIGIDVHTVIYIRQITNKDRVYGTENSHKGCFMEWFLLRSERCQESHEVKERGSSREKWH